VFSRGGGQRTSLFLPPTREDAHARRIWVEGAGKIKVEKQQDLGGAGVSTG
jgi:hypothetical protein